MSDSLGEVSRVFARQKEKGKKGQKQCDRVREEGEKALDKVRIYVLASGRMALRISMSRNRELREISV